MVQHITLLPILFIVLAAVDGVPLSAKDTLALQTSTSTCGNVDKSCCGVGNAAGLLDFVPQNFVPVDFLRIALPNIAMTCDCGKAIKSRYTPCLSLPLANETSFEAITVRTYLDLKVGGFVFTAPTGKVDTDMCFAYSMCSKTFGIHLDSPLKFCWPNPMGATPEGPICFKPTTFMFSDTSAIEFKSMSGLWNGAEGTTDVIPFRGELYLGGYFTIGLADLAGMSVSMELYGKMLFSVDTSKPPTSWTKAFSTLFGGSINLKNDLPGFQFTFDAKAILNFAWSPTGDDGKKSSSSVQFNLVLGGATLTMGVNMQDVTYSNGNGAALRPFKGFTNGIYGCGYESIALPDLIPGLSTFFGDVDWPEASREICFFFDQALSMRLRMTGRISMFGGYFEVQYSMVNMRRTLDLTFVAWVFDVNFHLMIEPPSIANPTGDGAIDFNLNCAGGGTVHCASKIGNEIKSQVTSWMVSAGKAMFTKNPFFLTDLEESNEDVEGENIEDLLDADLETSQGWKKKKFKVKVPPAKKIVKTVVKAVPIPVPSFSSSGAFVNVGSFQMTGTLPRFRFSMSVSAGIKIVSKTYKNSATIAVDCSDPANLGQQVLNMIKSQVVDKMF